MTGIRKLPIGIQDFEYLRANDFLYVDKTAYVHQLALMGKAYFLGRPRRFGKSLFLSTLKAYFEGKKDLFDGLAIAEQEKDWVQYPVFHIDFNVGLISDAASLRQRLSTIMTLFEKQWGGRMVDDDDPATRFETVIRQAHEKSGNKIVVLIDEYDKPLVNTLDNPDVNEAMRNVLKGFYGILKSADAHLRFVFLTGVTKFSKVSVFSDLNHLNDISMDDEYAAICGISESELIHNFRPEIEALAEKENLSYEATLAELKKRYDGYHFAKASENMYNPFSLLNTFFKKDFGIYWFATGTPTFLVKMLKDVSYNLNRLENDVKVSANAVTDYRAGQQNPVPLLYQSGYLTIKSYDKQDDEYTLGYPNEEVKYGFLNNLLPEYMPDTDFQSEFYILNFVKDLRSGNVDGFMTRLKAFFAGISYELNSQTEKDFQTVFYLLFRLMGQYIQTEMRSAIGRADAVVITSDTVFIFEFKLTERASAEKALRQIDEKNYALPYAASNKKIVKAGVTFSKKEHTLKRWVTG